MKDLLIWTDKPDDPDMQRVKAAFPDAIFGDMPDEAARSGIRAVAYKWHTPFGAEQMDMLPNLRVISSFGVGFDPIDIAAATARGVRVTNTPDVLNDDVADLAVAMLLDQLREMRRGETWVRSGTWAQGPMPLNRTLSGERIGVVGLGRIGREIADRLAAFKTQIHYHSRAPKETPGWTYHADVMDLARAVNVLVIALVGGAETRHYVTRDTLAALGARGIVINISRGTTVDETALLDALEDGTISGAGLDVFENEPNIDPRFLALDNVVLQPHQASATKETRRAMGDLQIDNLRAFFDGRDLLTPVN
jgi:lactate dehydrogenase-like 2-hydroxyacid dehydrogenase